jgi:GNAT superfamily N-acetyltransferase
MEVRAFDEPALFAEHTASFLEIDPFSSSVIAGQIDAVIAGIRRKGREDTWWAVLDGHRVVGTAMHTPPHNLFVTRMPGRAATSLARSLLAARRELPGVAGERNAVTAFAAAWEDGTGQKSSTDVLMRLYRLADLTSPRGVSGAARPAASDEAGLVSAWLAAFHDEAQPYAPVQHWETLARQRITVGQFRLWEDAKTAVSMAAFTRPVAGVSRVGPVYTPPHHRKLGYGAAVTADATRAAISTGAQHVVLYTDLSNPTSNAIYQAIGYRPDHDAEERTFAPLPRPTR